MENVKDYYYLKALIYHSEGEISLNEYISLNKTIKIKNKNILINGNGNTIDANGKSRIFYITGGNVVLKNIIFKNAKAPTNFLANARGYGGAILNMSNLKLINCEFINNFAKNDGNDILNMGNLKIINCKFSQNNNKNHAILNRSSIQANINEKDSLTQFISNENIEWLSVPNESNFQSFNKKTYNPISLDKNCDVNTQTDLEDDSPNQIIINRPFPAYEGERPYIFVSYAHKDAKLVFPEIKKFHVEGYPIWYDQGLTPGQEWTEEIAVSLINSSLVIVFISENSINSKNVRNEINMALNRNIDVVPIYLKNTELPPSLELLLSDKHAIFKYLTNDSEFLFECFKAFDKSKIGKIEFQDAYKS